MMATCSTCWPPGRRTRRSARRSWWKIRRGSTGFEKQFSVLCSQESSPWFSKFQAAPSALLAWFVEKKVLALREKQKLAADGRRFTQMGLGGTPASLGREVTQKSSTRTQKWIVGGVPLASLGWKEEVLSFLLSAFSQKTKAGC